PDRVPGVSLLAGTARLADSHVLDALPARQAVIDSLFVKKQGYGPFEFDVLGDPYIGNFTPIRSGGGDVIGALWVARSNRAGLAGFRQLRSTLFQVGSGALLLSVPLSFLLAHGLARPLRQLAHSAEEIGRGQLSVALPRAAGGEVGLLSHAFEAMVT